MEEKGGKKKDRKGSPDCEWSTGSWAMAGATRNLFEPIVKRDERIRGKGGR